MRRRQATEFPPPPFVLLKAYSFGPSEVCVAALDMGDSYFYLEHLVGYGHLAMGVVKKTELGGVQFKRTDLAATQALADMKSKALRTGATLEAIQLLKGHVPVTKEEERTMAEAGTKLSRKAADKDGLKSAAKSAPVNKAKGAAPKTDAPKRKGNPEALAKARAARTEGPDNRKITVLKKDHGARDGTKRADLLNKIFKAKTVQGAVDSGVAKSDVSWASRAGYISLA